MYIKRTHRQIERSIAKELRREAWAAFWAGVYCLIFCPIETVKFLREIAKEKLRNRLKDGGSNGTL